MLKAYETEGHGTCWQVFRWAVGQEQDAHIKDMDTLQEVIDYARESKLPLTLYTQDWYLEQEEGKI